MKRYRDNNRDLYMVFADLKIHVIKFLEISVLVY